MFRLGATDWTQQTVMLSVVVLQVYFAGNFFRGSVPIRENIICMRAPRPLALIRGVANVKGNPRKFYTPNTLMPAIRKHFSPEKVSLVLARSFECEEGRRLHQGY